MLARSRLLTIALAAVVTFGPAVTGVGSPYPEANQERWIVDLDDATPGEIRRAAAQTGAHLAAIDTTLGYAAVDDVRRDQLEHHLGVSVSPDPAFRLAAQSPIADAPDDPLFGSQWGAADLNLPQAWAIEDGSPNVTIAVIDSGITLKHEDIPYDRVRFGHDYPQNDSTPEDENGHGTEVAGVIIASRDNGAGIAGVANVELYVIKVVDRAGGGSSFDIAQAIREAADVGANIASLSLSSSGSEPMEEAVSYARSRGTLVVAAAGNDQDNAPERCVGAPARYPGAIAVGALEPPPGPGLASRNAEYSCQGPEVELVAPGSYVMTTTSSFYFPQRGTSFAAPHVAGVAGLVASYDASLNDTGIRERLNATADDMGDPGRDPVYGHGKVDPVEALSGASPVYVPTPRS